jgi:hypothetical protein
MGGAYDVSFTVALGPPRSVTLLVTGEIVMTTGETSAHVIEATYSEGGGPGETLPPFMRYAVFSERQVTLNANPSVFIQSGDGLNNADLHTNQGGINLGGLHQIEGFFSYGGSITPAQEPYLSAMFLPVDNPGGDLSFVKVPPMGMPSFAAAEHAGAADQLYATNLVLDAATYTLGTRSAPLLWVVQGDLTINDGAVFDGYGMILATGNIMINGDMSVIPTGYAESSLGLYTNGNVQVANNATAYGQMYAGGDVILNEGSALYGTLAADGFNFNGSSGIQITHVRASPALAGPVFGGGSPGPGGLYQTDYRQWNR